MEVVKPKGKDFPDLTSVVEGATTEAYVGSADVVVRFEATGEPHFLAQARYWAWTGVPFVYLRQSTPGPVGMKKNSRALPGAGSRNGPGVMPGPGASFS